MLNPKFTSFEQMREFINSDYEVLKQKMICEASNKMEELKKVSLPKKTGPDTEFIKKLWKGVLNPFKDLCLFPDDQIKIEYKRLGIPAVKMKWFIPILDIEREFDKIESSQPLIVYKSLLIHWIQFHLDLKFKYSVIKWVKTLPKGLDLEKYMGNFMRRLSYGKGEIKRPENVIDIVIQHQNSKLEELQSKEGLDKNILQKSISGETPQFIFKEIVEGCVKDGIVSERTKLTALFDLFRLICKDKDLKSENQFLEWIDKKQKAGREPKYDGDYNNYKYFQIKALIR